MTPGSAQTDWDPEAYHRFRGHRLRPALDLLARVPALPPGDVVDLGCGAGDLAEALTAAVCRPQGRRLIGVDTSETMLSEAAEHRLYNRLDQTDIAVWQPETPVALIFSNAALHWIGDHRALLPRLVEMLVPGGMLAVQVPHQNRAPSHRLWHSLCDEFFPGRLDGLARPGVLSAADYHHLLAPLGDLAVWETEYYQPLSPDGNGHPVRRFTEATFARPILQALSDGEQARLIAAYEDVIGAAYPEAEDGTVLFPFRRLFLTLVRD